MTEENTRIHRIRSTAFNSRKNFGDTAARKRGESNFLRAFERAYFASVDGGIVANEFAQPQLGVADLIWVAWNNEQNNSEFTALTIEKILRRRSLVAFEAKLKDWQQALRQAYRYRYFADKSIVVMPDEYSGPALRNLSIFEEMGVGLWVFKKSTNQIKKAFTPVGIRALNKEAREKAIKKISSQVNIRKLRK